MELFDEIPKDFAVDLWPKQILYKYSDEEMGIQLLLCIHCKATTTETKIQHL